MIDQKADVNAKAAYGWAPLHDATDLNESTSDEYLDPQMTVMVLLNAGADINARTKSGSTPLHSAAFKGHRVLGSMIMMIQSRADINKQNDYGNTPLHILASRMIWKKDMLASHFLVDVMGADLTIKNNDGKTPYDIFLRRVRESILEWRSSY